MSNIIYCKYENNQRSRTHPGYCKRSKEQFTTRLDELGICQGRNPFGSKEQTVQKITHTRNK